jgi:hypothetical protein
VLLGGWRRAPLKFAYEKEPITKLSLFEAKPKDRNCFDVPSLLADKFGAKKERSLLGSGKDGLDKNPIAHFGAMSAMGIFHQWIQRNLSDSARSREKRSSESPLRA